MLNANELNTKEDMINKSNDLSYQLVDVQNELEELKQMKAQLLASLQIVEDKLNRFEQKRENIINDLDDVTLCKNLIYNDLSTLGSEFVGLGPLRRDAKTVLLDHGCKIVEDNENEEYKVKRIILGKLK